MDCVENIFILSCSGPYVPTLLSKSPYSVRMWENADQKNPEYGRVDDVQYYLSIISTFHCERKIYIGNPLFDNFDKYF